ncbi:MAG: hypothetical protein KC547_19275 [Anaerolineae bacterium]|nr:hypothetical protein [Anaerolineae bacterium]
MSEFTSGILYLRKHHELAQRAIAQLPIPYLIHDLNTNWSGLFTPDEYLQQKGLLDWLHHHSIDLPILRFEHPADHGWGYTVFRQGAQTASLWVNYEISYNMWRDFAEQRYPGTDVHLTLTDEEARTIHEEVRRSDVYQKAVRKQFATINVSEFAAFGLSAEHIAQLSAILSDEWYLDSDRMLRQVEEFKRILNIKEMAWKSYRYLLRQKRESPGETG